jgi:hypothetical protein
MKVIILVLLITLVFAHDIDDEYREDPQGRLPPEPIKTPIFGVDF